MAVERRGDDRYRHLAAVTPLDDALGLRAALAGGERLAEPAHHRGVGREDLLDVAPLGAPRRALGEDLGRGVPEDHAEVAIDRDHGVRKAGQDRLKVHCSGGLEAGLDRGWPDADAAWLRHAQPTPDAASLRHDRPTPDVAWLRHARSTREAVRLLMARARGPGSH